VQHQHCPRPDCDLFLLVGVSLPSGKRLHNELENQHAINGKTKTISMAMASIPSSVAGGGEAPKKIK
jgi:hypothetical protein